MNDVLRAWEPSGLLDELLDRGGGGVPDVARAFTAVSYTHLTLPTICSV